MWPPDFSSSLYDFVQQNNCTKDILLIKEHSRHRGLRKAPKTLSLC